MLEQLLVGRRIWVVDFGMSGTNEDGSKWTLPPSVYNCRVLKMKSFLGAGPVGEGDARSAGGVRKKHLVQLWTDPGGLRTLSVGSIRLKDPGRVAAGIAAAEAREMGLIDQDDV